MGKQLVRRNREHVEQLEKRLAESRAQLRLSGLAAGQAEAGKNTIAAAEARGDLTAEKAAQKFAKADATETRHRREVDRLQRLVVAMERELERRRDDVALAEYEAQLEAADVICVDVNRDLVRLKAQLANAAKLAEEIAGKREARRAALAHASELRPDHVDGESPEHLDEPEWRPGGWETLVGLIESGPQRPTAITAAAAARHRDDSRERRISAAVGEALRRRRPELLDELPAELRDDARRRFQRTLDDPHAGRQYRAREAVDDYVETGDESYLEGLPESFRQAAKQRREQREREQARAGVRPG